MLPITFLFRAGVYYMCYIIKDPWDQKVRYYATVPFIHVSLYMVNMVILTYLSKMYPKNIRSICMTACSIFGAIGGFIFPAYFEYLYEINPSMPFLGVTYFDTGSAILCLILFLFGFGNPRPETADDDDSNLSGSIHSEQTEELGKSPILSNM